MTKLRGHAAPRLPAGRRCTDEGTPAYWPWRQILRAHLHGAPATAVLENLGTGAVVVASVFTEIAQLVDADSAPPSDEPDNGRFRFFDALTEFFRRAAYRQRLHLPKVSVHG